MMAWCRVFLVFRKIIIFCSYWAGIDTLFYWLNKKAKRIVTFHNVLPDHLMSGYPRVGCVTSVDDFRKIIAEVGKRFRFSVDLHDSNTATITFDDGLINQYEVAGEILRQMGIPAILFVTGDVIGALPKDTIITDKVLLWNMFAPDDAVRKVFGVVLPRGRLWVEYVQPAYRKDAERRGRTFLSSLERAYPIEKILDSLSKEWSRLRLSGVTHQALVDLRARGWQIGWHTKSHYPLGMLNAEEIHDELDSPMEYRAVPLCYPYGDYESIGADTIRIAKEMGYSCAVSNDPDYSPHRDRFFMLRMSLPPSKAELHFVLSGFKYFLKYRKLLPIVN